MSHQSTAPLIHACVLAAGASSRFGGVKLVHPVRGLPLLQYALLAAIECRASAVSLVVGNYREVVINAAADLYDQLIINDCADDGIGSSIASGVREMPSGSDAVLILLADQPLITAEHLNNMIDRWVSRKRMIVATSSGRVVCPPILFPAAVYAQLQALTGDHGAKSILEDRDNEVQFIEFPDAQFDVDTRADLREIDSRAN